MAKRTTAESGKSKERKQIMKFLTFAFIFGICSVSCFSKEVKANSMSFQVDNNVSLEKNTEQFGKSLIFKFNEPGKFFMLSPNQGASKSMIKKMTEMTMANTKGDVKRQKGMELKTMSSHDVSLGIFSGTEIETVIVESKSKRELKQYQYVLWDGSSCWTGRFVCGVADDITAVHNILKSGKKIK